MAGLVNLLDHVSVTVKDLKRSLAFYRDLLELKGLAQGVSKMQGREEGEGKARAVETLPLGRIQQPENAANFTAFLASKAASYMTGQAYNVCGRRLPI